VKKSTKAILLSALVFPGLGHVYLKKYITGFVLIGASLAASYYFISQLEEKAVQITQKLQSGDVPLDVNAIEKLVSQQSNDVGAERMNMATMVLGICWIFGIIGSYRGERVQVKSDST